MGIRQKSITARTILYFFGVFVPIFLFVFLTALSSYRVQLRSETKLVQQNERLLIDFQAALISNQLNSAVEEMKYLSAPPEGMERSGPGVSPDEKVIEYYTGYLARNSGYASITLFDVELTPVYQVERGPGGEIIERTMPDLRPVQNLYHIQRASMLEPGSIFVSRMDLSNGNPSIRFIAPIVSTERFYLELVYEADRLLSMVRNAAGISIGETMLLNANGYWLHSPQPDDEWGFMSPERMGKTFAARYDDAWNEITRVDSGIYESDEGAFVYRTVYPIMDPRSDARESTWNLVYDPGPFGRYGDSGDDLHWYLVSFVPPHRVENRVEPFRARLIFITTTITVLLAGVSILLSLTRRRRLLAETKVTEEAAIFMNNPAPVMRVRSDGSVIKLNPAASKVIGRTTTGSTDLLTEFDPGHLQSLKLNEPYQFEQELRGRHYFFTAKKNADDRTFLLYGSDITGIKEIEQEIRKLSTAVEQSATSILITDLDGTITFANQACADSSGHTVEELLGANTRIFNSGSQPHELYRDLWETISQGNVWHGELQNRKKSGEIYWEDVSITPLRNESGRISGYLAVKEDITTRKTAEDQLKAAKNEAEAASKLKSEFLANMSHEIRTPLNSIVGFTDVLLEDIQEADKRRSLEVIKRSSRHLLLLINDILDFSKIEADKIRIEPNAFSIRGVIHHLQSIFEESIREKHLYFNVDIDDVVPSVLTGDEHRITQVLLNVISNAIKFTESGGISLTVEYADGLLTIRLSDTGIGIAQQKLVTIFSAFEQASTSTERMYGGTGLGLAITKRLVELMAGTVSVESTIGRGSTFTISLPLPIASVEQVAMAEEVVEDSRDMVDGWFAALGHDELLHGVLRKGIRDLPDKLAKITDALGAHDLDRLMMIAHDLKGYSGNLGMHQVYEVAKELHDGLHQSRIDEASAKSLVDRLGETIGAIPGSYFEDSSVKSESASTEDGRSLRVLAAEDNEANRELLKVLLDRIGVYSAFVANGREALDALERGRFDVLLLDMQMPVMDGVETIHQIRGRSQFDELHVIAVTANAMEGDANRYISLGCDDYLSKPIDRAILKQKLDAIARASGCASIARDREKVALSDEQIAELTEIVAVLESNTARFQPKEIHEAGSRLSRLVPQSREIRSIGARLLEASEELEAECIPGIIERLSGFLS